MVARVIEINAWQARASSRAPAAPVEGSWRPPVPTDAPAPSAAATHRSPEMVEYIGKGRCGSRRALPVSDTDPECPPLSAALQELCKSLPTASLRVSLRASPGPITPETSPEMPAVLQPPPSSAPWLDDGAPGAEAARDTDTSELRPSVDPSAPPSALAERDRAILLRLDGSHAGQVFSLAGDANQIGRHPTAQISIQERGVSRIHARIYQRHGVYWIEDLGSRNGTYVQGRRIDHCILEDGDWVQLGPRASFRFTFVDPKQEQVLHQLYDSSTRDALTGAHNRAHFDERLRAEIAYALRHATTVSLVLLDIDRFKKVNDTYGHPAGDAVLKHIAATVQARLRTEDVFARYGGEEFVIILRGIDIKGAGRVGERVRATIGSSLVFHEGRHIAVSVSAGCASLDCSEERSAEALLAAADRRLYLAKRAGRNRVVDADPPIER